MLTRVRERDWAVVLKGDRREIGGATAVGYIRARSLTEGGCVAWVLRLVEIGAEGERSCADVVEISRPDGLVDIADLGLTLAEAKLVLAGVQREIVAAQANGGGRLTPNFATLPCAEHKRGQQAGGAASSVFQ